MLWCGEGKTGGSLWVDFSSFFARPSPSELDSIDRMIIGTTGVSPALIGEVYTSLDGSVFLQYPEERKKGTGKR
jgi:hypothetical protein